MDFIGNIHTHFCGKAAKGRLSYAVIWVNNPRKTVEGWGVSGVRSGLPAQGQMESPPNGGSQPQTPISCS